MIDTKRLATDAAYWDSVAPEGATHYDKDFAHPWTKIGAGLAHYWCGSNGWLNATSPRGGIPRPQSEWVDGLPPVGCECEFSLHLFGARSDWEKCEFLARNEKRGVSLILTERDCEIVFDSDQPRFRPVKTKAQRDRDELGKVVENALIEHERTCEDPIEYTSYDAVIDAILSRYNLEPKP